MLDVVVEVREGTLMRSSRANVSILSYLSLASSEKQKGKGFIYHDLHADHTINRAVHDPKSRQRLLVLEPARDQRVLAVLPKLGLAQPVGQHLRKGQVRLDAVDVRDLGGVEARELVARAGAEFEHGAVRRGYEGWHGSVLLLVFGKVVAFGGGVQSWSVGGKGGKGLLL